MAKDQPKNKRRGVRECVTLFRTKEIAVETIAHSSISTGVMQQREEIERVGAHSSTVAEEEDITNKIQRQLGVQQYVLIFRGDDAHGSIADSLTKNNPATNNNNKPRSRDRQTLAVIVLEAQNAHQCGKTAYATIRIAEESMVEMTRRKGCAISPQNGSIAIFSGLSVVADFRIRKANQEIKREANRETRTTFRWGKALLRKCLKREVPSLKTKVRGAPVLGLVSTRGPNTTALFMNPL